MNVLPGTQERYMIRGKAGKNKGQSGLPSSESSTQCSQDHR